MELTGVLRLAATWLLVCSAPGCTSEPPSEAGSACAYREAIIGGSTEEHYLGLTPEERNAVVQVRLFRETGTLVDLCSGVLVGSGRVLTARHCAHGEESLRVELRFGADAADPDHVLAVLESSEHPSLDLLLLAFDADALPQDYARPLPLPQLLPPSLVGSVAVLAGFGASEAPASERRRFAAEMVSQLESDFVLVSGGQASGACLGDSGGPLLGRAVDGLVRVYGVLSDGPVTCRGDDRYTRLDRDAEWAARSGLTSAVDAEWSCDGWSEEGRCFGEVAVWCEANQLRRERCETPAACGWSAESRGYRCGDPASDPCRGVPDSGRCDGARASSCRAGKRLEVDCEACADTCMISPVTGRVACAALEEP